MSLADENERAIAKTKKMVQTGVLRIDLFDEKKGYQSGVTDHLKALNGQWGRSVHGSKRNEGVNQCRFGAAGPQQNGVDGSGIACGYGIRLPVELPGLADFANLKTADVVSIVANVIVPKNPEGTSGYFESKGAARNDEYWNHLDAVRAMAANFFFAEVVIEGVIKEVHANSTLLQGEGKVFRVVPVSTRLTADTRKRFTETKRIGSIAAPDALERHILDNYTPLKIGRMNLVYWVGVYTDMQTAQVVVTTERTTYAQLEENLAVRRNEVILGSYPVSEINHLKHRTSGVVSANAVQRRPYY